MKWFKLFILSALIVSFQSCLDSEEPDVNYFSLGDITSITSGVTINLNDSTFVTDEQFSNEDDYVVGDRVMFVYNVLEVTTTEPEYSAIVDIKDIGKVLTKDIINVDEVSRDTLEQAEVQIEGVAVQDHYINVQFYFYGATKKHYFALAFDSLQQNIEGKYILDFTHNDHDDQLAYAYQGVMSFDLNSLEFTGTDPIKIQFRYKALDRSIETVELTYTRPEEDAE